MFAIANHQGLPELDVKAGLESRPPVVRRYSTEPSVVSQVIRANDTPLYNGIILVRTRYKLLPLYPTTPGVRCER